VDVFENNYMYYVTQYAHNTSCFVHTHTHTHTHILLHDLRTSKLNYVNTYQLNILFFALFYGVVSFPAHFNYVLN